MYLTRLRLDPLAPRASRLIGQSYELHRWLMRGFNGGREANGVLFRVEPERSARQVLLLVQSLVEPDWSPLATEPGLAGPPETKPFDLALEPGRRLRFRLRANPVRRVSRVRADDPLAGKRVGLYREEEQRRWLARQAEPCGVDWLDLEVNDRGTITSRKGDLTLSHHCVDFDGRLTVVAPDRLRQAVATGLGPAKAFGFGLLSLAPA